MTHSILHSSLNPDEQQRFKDLYMQGYSATSIFALLGQPYERSFMGQNAAQCRMVHYRKLLKLPKRYPGFHPIRVVSRDEQIRLRARKQMMIQELAGRIELMTKRIEMWKTELRNLAAVEVEAKTRMPSGFHCQTCGKWVRLKVSIGRKKFYEDRQCLACYERSKSNRRLKHEPEDD